MGAMPGDEPFTRREGDQLARRIEAMDRDGTRGMGVIAVQVNHQAQQIGELRVEMRNAFAAHTDQHTADAKAAASRGRWRVGAWIAGIASAAAALSLLVSIASQLSRLHP